MKNLIIKLKISNLRNCWNCLEAYVVGLSEENRRWDKLAAIGNHPLAKLTIIVPILGVFILFSDGVENYLHSKRLVLEGSFPSWRVYLTYFALFLVSIGQVLYSLQCPNFIKMYGSASEFITREIAVTSQGRVIRMLQDIISKGEKNRLDSEFVKILDGQVNQAQAGNQYKDESNSFIVLNSAWNKMISGHDFNQREAKKNEYVSEVMKVWFVKDKYIKSNWAVAVFYLYVSGLFLVLVIASVTFFLILISGYDKFITYIFLMLIWLGVRLYKKSVLKISDSQNDNAD